MPVRESRQNVYSTFILRLFYNYAKLLGLVFFKITTNNKVKLSKTMLFVAVSYRILSLVVYSTILPQIFQALNKTDSVYVKRVLIIQFTSVVGFTALCAVFQMFRHKQFLSVVNRTIEIFFRTAELSKNLKFFGGDFYWTAIKILLCNLTALLLDFKYIYLAISSSDILCIARHLLGYVVWFGTFAVIDTICLGYLMCSEMYRNIGNHMAELVKRFGAMESLKLTKFHQMHFISELSEELEECASIYSEIFKITQEYHSLVQLNIFCVFCVDLLTITCNIHYLFWVYFLNGLILWNIVGMCILGLVHFLTLIMVIDNSIRYSKIPKQLNWQCLLTMPTIMTVGNPWRRSVDRFMNQLRIEDLKFSVFGLFELRNQLSLWFVSVIVGFVTIMIQFSIMGYLREIPSEV